MVKCLGSPAGGLGWRRPSAWRGLQGGGGGAVHSVVLRDETSGASYEGGVPRRHGHSADARLVPEAATPTRQSGLRFRPRCHFDRYSFCEKSFSDSEESFLCSSTGFISSKINKLSDWNSGALPESRGGHGHASTLPRMSSLSRRYSGLSGRNSLNS